MAVRPRRGEDPPAKLIPPPNGEVVDPTVLEMKLKTRRSLSRCFTLFIILNTPTFRIAPPPPPRQSTDINKFPECSVRILPTTVHAPTPIDGDAPQPVADAAGMIEDDAHCRPSPQTRTPPDCPYLAAIPRRGLRRWICRLLGTPQHHIEMAQLMGGGNGLRKLRRVPTICGGVVHPVADDSGPQGRR
jgi:hypothetical protein